MNQEQKQKYLANSGVTCPYCGSGQLDGEGCDIEAGRAYQAIFCRNCAESWVDIYSLVDVSPLED